MKTYDELTEEVLEKVKTEKKRRRGLAKKITSAVLAVVLAGGGIFAAYRSGALTGKVKPAEIGGVIAAASEYGDVYDLLNFTPEGDRDAYGVIEKDASGSPEAVDYEVNTSESAPVDREALTVSGDGYSRTNVQVDGIDEADVVKTDGKYIYAVSYVNVYILSAENGELETVAKIPYREQDNAAFSPDPTLTVPWDSPDIYIDGDRLAVVAHTYRADEENSDNYADDYYYWYMPYGGHSYFTAAVYDIADRTAPALVSSVSVSGDGVSSRLSDGKLYLVAADRYYGEPDRDDPESYIPSVYKNGEAELVSPGAIYCGSEESACKYLNVMEITVSDASVASSVSLLGYDGEIMYQSADNIFVARTDYLYDSSSTEEDGITTSVSKFDYDTIIAKISIEAGLTLAGSVRLEGYVHNSFSMDEFEGYLRVVTSVDREETVSSWREIEPETVETYTDPNGVPRVDPGEGETEYYYDGIEYDYPDYYGGGIDYISDEWNEDMYNNLYVLDSAMNVTGKLEGLAPDERIYSCRFEGTDGYFVTYRETDPLFHVDLSDPTAPHVIDELTLPGHSDYLERFGDLLFGFGEDDEGNLKLSMFREDENGAMSEISTVQIPGAYYSEVAYDHHAVLADAGRGIICFGAETWSENEYGSSKFYIVFWNGQSFEIKMAAAVGDWSGAIRSLYIGDFIYLYVMDYASGSSVTSFSLTTYEQVDREELDAGEPDLWYGAVDYAVTDG